MIQNIFLRVVIAALLTGLTVAGIQGAFEAVSAPDTGGFFKSLGDTFKRVEVPQVSAPSVPPVEDLFKRELPQVALQPAERDMCYNINGIQPAIPEGLVRDDDGNCITQRELDQKRREDEERRRQRQPPAQPTPGEKPPPPKGPVEKVSQTLSQKYAGFPLWGIIILLLALGLGAFGGKKAVDRWRKRRAGEEEKKEKIATIDKIIKSKKNLLKELQQIESAKESRHKDATRYEAHIKELLQQDLANIWSDETRENIKNTNIALHEFVEEQILLVSKLKDLKKLELEILQKNLPEWRQLLPQTEHAILEELTALISNEQLRQEILSKQQNLKAGNIPNIGILWLIVLCYDFEKKELNYAEDIEKILEKDLKQLLKTKFRDVSRDEAKLTSLLKMEWTIIGLLNHRIADQIWKLENLQQKLSQVQAAPPVPPTPPGPTPTWLQENIDHLNELAKKFNIADTIEELSAQRLTAKQVTERLSVILSSRGINVPVEFDSRRPDETSTNLEAIVYAVRAKRGIPSMRDKDEFEEWLRGRRPPQQLNVKIEIKEPEEANTTGAELGRRIYFNVKNDGKSGFKLHVTSLDKKNAIVYESPEYTYDSPPFEYWWIPRQQGTYTVNFKVTDADNKEGTGSVIVKVSPQPLHVNITSPKEGADLPLNETIRLEAKGSKVSSNRYFYYLWNIKQTNTKWMYVGNKPSIDIRLDSDNIKDENNVKLAPGPARLSVSLYLTYEKRTIIVNNKVIDHEIDVNLVEKQVILTLIPTNSQPATPIEIIEKYHEEATEVLKIGKGEYTHIPLVDSPIEDDVQAVLRFDKDTKTFFIMKDLMSPNTIIKINKHQIEEVLASLNNGDEVEINGYTFNVGITTSERIVQQKEYENKFPIRLAK